MTGKTTLYLVKRPGVTVEASSFGASSNQNTYLISKGPQVNIPWVFYYDTTITDTIYASNGSTATAILASPAPYIPTFVDLVPISGAETLVVQLTGPVPPQKVYFSTAIGTFTQITDGDFTSINHVGKMEFMDGYAFIQDNVGKIWNSDLNSLSNWTASSFITRGVDPDSGIGGLARLGNQIISFGAYTMEVFYNAGNATGSPLSRVNQLSARVGIGHVNQNAGSNFTYYATIKNKIFFIGTTQKGSYTTNISKGFYSYNGSAVEKISSDSIDKILSATAIQTIYSITFQGKQAIAITLSSFPGASSVLLIYFPEWNEWFEWTSSRFASANDGRFYIGTTTTPNKIYSFANTNTWQDNTTDYQWLHQFVLPTDGNQRKRMPYLGLKGDTATSAQNISVEFSDNDYATFSTPRNIDMTSKDKRLTRCGSFKGHRVVRLSHTGNTEVRLEAFLARIE